LVWFGLVLTDKIINGTPTHGLMAGCTVNWTYYQTGMPIRAIQRMVYMTGARRSFVIALHFSNSCSHKNQPGSAGGIDLVHNLTVTQRGNPE
jgi:hypothetical protein